MGNTSKQDTSGFYDAVKHLTESAAENIFQETNFEKLYNKLTRTPEGIDFKPLDTGTKKWPALNAIENTDEVIEKYPMESEVKRFFNKMLDAAKNKDKKSSNSNLFHLDKNKTQKNKKIFKRKSPNNKNKPRNLNFDIQLGEGLNEVIKSQSGFQLGESLKKLINNQKNSRQFKSSEENTPSKFPLHSLSKNTPRPARDIIDLMINTISVIGKDLNTIYEAESSEKRFGSKDQIQNKSSQRKNTLTIKGKIAKQKKSNPLKKSRFNQSSQSKNKKYHASKQNKKNEPGALTIQCIEQLTNSKQLNKQKILTKDDRATDFNRSTLSDLKRQWGQTLNSNKLAQVKQDKVEAPSKASQKKLAEIDAIQLADKVDHVLRDQAWLNGVDLS